MPSKDSQIRFEVWMPASNWNGKFLGLGNGAMAGSISYGSMAAAFSRGYAASSTDTGHEGSGQDGSFALGHREKVIDFGYRAVHEMTVKAKLIIAAYYGRASKFSYWNGCSTGGRQGVVEAQRFPGDYNGIVAGAPEINLTHMQAASVWKAQAIRKNPGGLVPPYGPTVNPRTGEQLFPGMVLGSELGWSSDVGRMYPDPPDITKTLATAYLRYAVFRRRLAALRDGVQGFPGFLLQLPRLFYQVRQHRLVDGAGLVCVPGRHAQRPRVAGRPASQQLNGFVQLSCYFRQTALVTHRAVQLESLEGFSAFRGLALPGLRGSGQLALIEHDPLSIMRFVLHSSLRAMLKLRQRRFFVTSLICFWLRRHAVREAG
jgi:hypothetical protein